MKVTSTKKPKDYIDPDKNLISSFDPDILVEAVNGRLDLNMFALREVRNRGLDKNGRWIGFEMK